MGRFEEDARFAVAQSVAQRTVAAGAVRIEQVARAGERVGTVARIWSSSQRNAATSARSASSERP